MRLSYLALLVLAGCGGSGGAPCTTTSMDTVQTQVFDGCSTGSPYGGCHAAAPFGASLDLTRGMAYAYLVHAPSNSSPGNWRVEPGDLDHSFLWRKLTDALATDASEGVPMPRDSSDQWAPLTQSQLNAVRCWITTGAPNE
jgi:hypothetical protein